MFRRVPHAAILAAIAISLSTPAHAQMKEPKVLTPWDCKGAAPFVAGELGPKPSWLTAECSQESLMMYKIASEQSMGWQIVKSYDISGKASLTARVKQLEGVMKKLGYVRIENIVKPTVTAQAYTNRNETVLYRLAVYRHATDHHLMLVVTKSAFK